MNCDINSFFLLPVSRKQFKGIQNQRSTRPLSATSPLTGFSFNLAVWSSSIYSFDFDVQCTSIYGFFWRFGLALCLVFLQQFGLAASLVLLFCLVLLHLQFPLAVWSSRLLFLLFRICQAPSIVLLALFGLPPSIVFL